MAGEDPLAMRPIVVEEVEVAPGSDVVVAVAKEVGAHKDH
jgi:hypothetical protein